MLQISVLGNVGLGADKFTEFSQTLTLAPDTLRERGVARTDQALAVLRNFRANLTDPQLLFRETKTDISSYDVLVESCRRIGTGIGFGISDLHRFISLTCKGFEQVDAAAISVGGSGFVARNIAEDQSAALIKRIPAPILADFARQLGTAAQVRQKVDGLIQLGEKKLAAEKAAKTPPSDSITVATTTKKPFPLAAKIAIGAGVAGVIGTVAIVLARR